MTQDWSTLKGQTYRLGVGKTTDEALADTDNPNIVHLTTDNAIVLNGEEFCNYDEVIATLAETLGAAIYTGELGGRSVTFYAGRKIVNLGSVSGSSVAEAWAKQAEVASSDVRLIFYEDTAKSQSGIILQTKTTTTGAVRQELFLGETHYIRTVFGTNTTTTTADSWKKTGVVSIAFTASSRLLALKNYDGKEIATVTLPEATTSAAGLTSATDKTKLDTYPSDYSTLQAAAAANLAINGDALELTSISGDTLATISIQSLLEASGLPIVINIEPLSVLTASSTTAEIKAALKTVTNSTGSFTAAVGLQKLIAKVRTGAKLTSCTTDTSSSPLCYEVEVLSLTDNTALQLLFTRHTVSGSTVSVASQFVLTFTASSATVSVTKTTIK